MPRRIEQDDPRLPASYANFYICNEHVIVPTYRDANDAETRLRLLREAFPGRHRYRAGLDRVFRCGQLHCLTQYRS